MKESQNIHELATQSVEVERSTRTRAHGSETGQSSLEAKNLVIGIDTGVDTGFAVWNLDTRKLEMVKTMKIHQAWLWLIDHRHRVRLVVAEDARMWKHFGGKDVNYKKQGAGSIKRDAKAWEDFLEDMNIPYRMVRPNKNVTKWDEDFFKKVTGWKKITSKHSRDAACLVYDYKLSPYEKQLCTK